MATFNLTATFILALAQWRIIVLAIRWVRQRGTVRQQVAALSTLIIFEAAVAAGYACTFSSLVSRLRLPPTSAPVFGACALAYLFASSIGVAIYTVIWPVATRLSNDTDPGRRRMLKTAGTAMVISPFAVVGYGALIERSTFRVREIDLGIPGLPDDLDGLRLLQLSDIHLSVFLSESQLARVIDASCELQPDLAFVTGDLISTFGDPLEACVRQLARVKADAGVFGCLGNHERYAGVEQQVTELGARAGISFLRAQSQQLRFGHSVLNVAGVDYQRFSRKRAYLRGAERLVTPGSFNVLLSHNPDVFPVAAQQGYDLMLAGHTHGGQVNIEILDQAINPARFFTPYVYGLYRSGNSTAYVTRGIGTIGIPARIGAPPEIALLRLRKA